MNSNLNTTPATIPASTPVATPNRSRFNPIGWGLGKKVTAGVLVAALAVGGWAAFRPEKLFVNETVSERLPTAAAGASGAPVLLSQGGFTGIVHHTEGKASLYSEGSQRILRLSDGFSTSNGPDVHVYLVEGANGADNAAIKSGKYLDLGVIKGNIGDQNYTLPASFDAAKYGSVSIWCKRFAVNFAAASLSPSGSSGAPSTQAALGTSGAQAQPVAMKADAQPTKPIVVTTGAFHQTMHATKGQATITEDSRGARTLTLTGFETGKGPKLHVYLWAAEQVADTAAAKKLVASKGFIDLGDLKSTTGTQTYTVPKDIDLWKFLSVGIWCDKFDVQFGVAPLAAPAS